MALSTTQYGYIIDPMVPFTDGKGNTIKDGFVRVFVAGSSTPVITYRNFDGAANQDLIELDNSGRTKTSVIGSKGLTYKVCVYDQLHSQESPILTVDKVSVIGANITAGAGATVVTGLDGLTTKPDGFVDASVVGTDGYVALDHTLVTDDLNTDAKATTVENDRYIPLLNEDVNDPDSKMTLGRLWQWVLGKIKSLSTTITDFRTGDVIPVDGPSGTAKMSKNDLLRVTAENAVDSDVAASSDSVSKTFTKLISHNIGNVVMHEGRSYVFANDQAEQEDWTAGNVERMPIGASHALYFAGQVEIETGGLTATGQPAVRTDRKRSRNFIPVTANFWKDFLSSSSYYSHFTFSLYGYDKDFNFISYTTTTRSRACVEGRFSCVSDRLLRNWVYYKFVAIPGKASYISELADGLYDLYSDNSAFKDVEGVKQDTEQIKQAIGESVSLEFVIGGINGANGRDNTRTDRMRINDYIPISVGSVYFPNLTLSGYNVKCVMNWYSADQSFISATSWFTLTHDVSFTNAPANAMYVRFVFRVDQISEFSDSDCEAMGSPSFSITLKNMVKDLEAQIEAIEIPTKIFDKLSVFWDKEIQIPDAVPIRTGISLGRSSTNGLQVWIFAQSNDEGTDTAKMYKCDFDPSAGSLSYTADNYILHNLGHCNSVSYNDKTDTLVLGNGSASYTIEGKLYIIENAKSRISMMQEDILVIDLPKANFGFKINAIWSEFDDCVYIISNDSHSIFKLQLGKGSNDLGSGTMHVVADGSFNGTYKVIAENKWGVVGRDYDNVVQGADFGNGLIFWGWGHNTGKISFRYGYMANTGEFDFHSVNQPYPDGEITATAEGMFTYDGNLYQLMSSRALYRIPIQFLK